MKIRSYKWGYAWLHVLTEDFLNYVVYIEERKFSYRKIPSVEPSCRKEFPSDCQTLEQKRSYLEALIKIGAMEGILEEV